MYNCTVFCVLFSVCVSALFQNSGRDHLVIKCQKHHCAHHLNGHIPDETFIYFIYLIIKAKGHKGHLHYIATMSSAYHNGTQNEHIQDTIVCPNLHCVGLIYSKSSDKNEYTPKNSHVSLLIFVLCSLQTCTVCTFLGQTKTFQILF